MQNFVHLQRWHWRDWMREPIERRLCLAWMHSMQPPMQNRLADRTVRRILAVDRQWPMWRPSLQHLDRRSMRITLHPKYLPACDSPVGLGSTRCRIGIGTVVIVFVVLFPIIFHDFTGTFHAQRREQIEFICRRSWMGWLTCHYSAYMNFMQNYLFPGC